MDYDAAMLKVALYCFGFILFLVVGNIITSINKEKKEQEEEEERARRAALREKKEREKDARRAFVAQQRRLMTDSLRYDVLQRDGFRCQICGATAADGYKLHVDHILPVSKGGKTEMSNLRTLCERCNMGKRDKIEKPGPTVLTPEQFAERISK